MSSCGVANCNKVFTDGAHCSACNKDFHFQCASVTKSRYRRLGDRKATWRCTKCQQGSSVSSGTAPAKEESAFGSGSSGRPLTEDEKSTCEVVSSVIRKMSANLKGLDTVAKEMEALQSQGADQTVLGASLAETCADLRRFFNEMRVMDEKVAAARETSSSFSEFEAKVADIGSKLDKQQLPRLNNIEIKGIPESQDENLYDIVDSIGKVVKYTVKKSQISFITRLQTQDTAKPIIVEFVNRFVKEEFVAAARLAMKNTPIRPLDLGYQGTNKIYINDHLSTKNKMLLSMAKKVGNDQGIRAPTNARLAKNPPPQ